ncbi:hypothetical protein [Streptomyces eurythermus]|uniref:hypothetical protein n=1 Tax=Streptomyces eurythermus TaxID=42237 RepID=UPI0036D40B91
MPAFRQHPAILVQRKTRREYGRSADISCTRFRVAEGDPAHADQDALSAQRGPQRSQQPVGQRGDLGTRAVQPDDGHRVLAVPATTEAMPCRTKYRVMASGSEASTDEGAR